MVKIQIDNSINKIKLLTDDSSVRYLLEGVHEEVKYLPWLKKMGPTKVTEKIYEERNVVAKDGLYTFTLGLGWAAYIANVFRSHISQEDYNTLANVLVAEQYRTLPFTELRDYQNEDVLHLLKYKIGLYSCYTGYGKTSVIATLANYAYSLGESVLIVTPGKKANDEIVKRLESMFGLKTPTADFRLNNMITSGLLNRSDVKNPDELAKLENLWKTYDWILVDEVEYTINDSGKFLYDRCLGAKHFYGFSGTTDKALGSVLTFADGLSESVLRNKELIKYFGTSLVFRLPLNKNVNCITVRTTSLANVKFDRDDFKRGSNVYQNVMTKLWTDELVCQTLVKVCERFPMSYIPINNLSNIIDTWIEKYFVGKFRVLLICFEGYLYYDLDGSKKNLTLTEACEYVKKGLVDVIPSTSSGYRALDLPGLTNAIIVQGKCAGVVLQAVGRVARMDEFNIISIEPYGGRKIPVYSKGLEERDDMVREYYRYCNINSFEITEENL